MTRRPRTFGLLAQCSIACLFASGISFPAWAQVQGRDTTAASVAATDLPLTPAQRQVYTGTYRTELPGGEKVTLRIFEEHASLKLWASEPDESRRLFHQGDNSFLMENAPGFVLTFLVVHDVAIKLTIRKPEGDLVAIRVN